MGKRWTAALGAVALLGTTLAPALSQSAASDDTGTISLAGQVVMRLRATEGGRTPSQRADVVRERLIPVLSLRSLSPSDVQVQPTRNGTAANIVVRGHLLVTVDRPEAQANHTTALALAQSWATNLRRTLPQSNAKPLPQNQGKL